MRLIPPRLVLASSSPRRRQLLAEAGYEFDVVPPGIDESGGLCSHCGPAELVTDLARQKAADVAGRLAQRPERPGGLLVVACDTVAECGGQILGKPRDEADARAMLKQLSGQRHRVYSGLCVWPLPATAPPVVQVEITTLRMDVLSGEQLDDYLAGGQWEGKAGAFGYQDGLDWVHVLEGSESNVVGLPMERLREMLARITRSL